MAGPKSIWPRFHSKCRTLGFRARVDLFDPFRRVGLRGPGYQPEEVRFYPGGDMRPKWLLSRELAGCSCSSLAPCPAQAQTPCRQLWEPAPPWGAHRAVQVLGVAVNTAPLLPAGRSGTGFPISNSPFPSLQKREKILDDNQ